MRKRGSYSTPFHIYAYISVLLLLLGTGADLHPAGTCHAVDDQEEGEEHNGEDIAEDDEQSYTRYAVQYPVDPRIGLTVDEPVVGNERRGDKQAVQHLDYHIIQQAVMLERKGSDHIVAKGDDKAQSYSHPHARYIQILGLETGTAVILGVTPLEDGHHLERNKHAEEQESAILAPLQDELHAQQYRHQYAGIEAGIVLRVAHGKDICYAHDARGYAYAPSSIMPLEQRKRRKKNFCQIQQAHQACEKQNRDQKIAA